MIDLNFYPEKHLDEMDGLLDLEVPQGWNLARFIRELYEAKLMLWAELLVVDDDGNVRWR